MNTNPKADPYTKNSK